MLAILHHACLNLQNHRTAKLWTRRIFKIVEMTRKATQEAPAPNLRSNWVYLRKKAFAIPIGWWAIPWFALAVGQNQWVCGDSYSEAFSIIAACLNLRIQLHFSLWSKKYWNQMAEAKAIIFGTVITVAVGYGQSCGLSNFSIYPPGVCVLSLFPFSTMGRVCRRDSSAASLAEDDVFQVRQDAKPMEHQNTPEVIHAMSNDSNLFELSMYKNTNWMRYPPAPPRELNNSTSTTLKQALIKCMIPIAPHRFHVIRLSINTTIWYNLRVWTPGTVWISAMTSESKFLSVSNEWESYEPRPMRSFCRKTRQKTWRGHVICARV